MIEDQFVQDDCIVDEHISRKICGVDVSCECY